MEFVIYIAAGLSGISVVLCLALLARMKKSEQGGDIEKLKKQQVEQLTLLRREVGADVQANVKSLGDMINMNMLNSGNAQSARLSVMDDSLKTSYAQQQQSLSAQLAQLEKRFSSFATENEQKLENIRATVEKSLASIREDNNKKLDEMRNTVDEKLQKTLEERIQKSFSLVSERLDMVSKGLGEMQNLATGVGDLKKVLSNVKTRGMLGEIQLGAILSEILSPEQYAENVVTVPGSRNPVEFAIKLPGDGGETVYLPIDSKFPADAYGDLMDAYESAAADRIKAAQTVLRGRLEIFAKDIREKYLAPPHTTDFAVMFLPTEGLYAEAVRLGMVTKLQNSYRVNIAGPSTMAALLNSLQMGFRTLAIQKRSGEVWQVLSAVKTEFNTFSDALQKAQKRLSDASDDLDKLVGVRTRQIQRKLKTVTELPSSEAAVLLADGEE